MSHILKNAVQDYILFDGTLINNYIHSNFSQGDLHKQSNLSFVLFYIVDAML